MHISQRSEAFEVHRVKRPHICRSEMDNWEADKVLVTLDRKASVKYTMNLESQGDYRELAIWQLFIKVL